MAHKIENPTFEWWLKDVFDHQNIDEWGFFDYDDDDSEEYYVDEEDPCRTVEYLRRLFVSPVEHTNGYSDAQIDAGLWELISSSGGQLYNLFTVSVPLELRVDTVKSMYFVYEKLFASRCSPHLCCALPPDHKTSVNPLNGVCYMWWDIVPLYGKSGDPVREVLDPYCLDVMEQTLRLPSIACQEGALHGLGHWTFAYPERVQSIIDQFLIDNPGIDTVLREYALEARNHGVQ